MTKYPVTSLRRHCDVTLTSQGPPLSIQVPRVQQQSSGCLIKKDCTVVSWYIVVCNKTLTTLNVASKTKHGTQGWMIWLSVLTASGVSEVLVRVVCEL